MNKYKLLLLDDVINHGRKGEIVEAKSGYARNFLLPRGYAVLATSATLRMKERLQKEREEQAKKDLEFALALKNSLTDAFFEVETKVDAEGHMYGSVSANDIALLLQNRGFSVEKRFISLHQPIRTIGKHQIRLKLPEGVETTIALIVNPDRVIQPKTEKKDSALVQQENAKETKDES